MLWSSLIVLGTFLRGPNWNFFGPFEYWDIHKLEPLTNVQLSDFIWVRLLGQPLPDNWFVREFFGIVLTLIYVAALPPLMARVFRRYYDLLGGTRFYVAAVLLLMMLSLPVKMLTRWVFNLKYVVSIPEYFFNI